MNQAWSTEKAQLSEGYGSGEAAPFPFTFIGALICLSVVLLPATRWDSATVDEPDHLTAGLAYWKTGDFSIGCDHPPLGRLWTALPTLLLSPDVALPSERAQMRQLYDKGVETLFHRDNPTREMLFIGRSANWALVCVAACLLFKWGSRLFGPRGGWAAALAFLLNPGVLAHGRLVTTDMGAGFGYLLACWGLAQVANRASLRNLVLGAFLVALSLCAKFNTIPILLALPAAVYLGTCRGFPMESETWDSCWKRSAIALGYSAIGAFLFVWGFYLFEFGSLGPIMESFLRENGSNLEEASTRFPEGLRAPILQFLRTIPVPFPSLWSGIAIVASVEREAYLFGAHSTSGWWYYLPTAFLLKTPVPLIFLYVAGSAAAIGQTRRHPAGRELIVALVALGAFWFLGCLSGWSIGYRHLLPAIPLHALLVGSLFGTREPHPEGATKWFRADGRWIWVFLLAAFLGVAVQYPRFVSYFNFLCGGSGYGYKYLIDSNCDWGQDIVRLADYCEKKRIDSAIGEVFCPDNLSYHGLAIARPSSFAEFRERIEAGEYGFVSVNFRQGFTAEARERWRGIETLPTKDRVGNSIFVYGGPP